MLDGFALVGAKIDKVYYCTDTPDKPTDMRKPNPGMLKKALNELNIKPEDAFMIGDSITDIEAANAAGCKAFLVLTGKGKNTFEREKEKLSGIKIYNTLLDAVNDILALR